MQVNGQRGIIVKNNLITMNIYSYRIFGLNVESELKLQELMISDGKADVNIRLGKVPSRLKSYTEISQVYQVSKTELLFTVQGVAKYYVHNGTEIIIEPFEDAKISSIKLFLLGTSFGVLLMQRGVIPLHGSAVEIDGKCVLFIGDSGAGKSTITASLLERGYKIISDDVIAVRKNDKTYLAYPSYPQQKLSNISLNYLGKKASDYKKVNIDDARNKYYVSRKHYFRESPMNIDKIVVLSIGEGLSVKLREIKGLEKLRIIMRNVYRAYMLKYYDMLGAQYSVCAGIASQAKCYTLIRPTHGMTVDQQIKLILDEI